MSKFDDLGPRILSAIVLAGVGLAAVFYGGLSFLVFTSIVGGLMIWELARMLQADAVMCVLLGLVTGLSIYAFGQNLFPYSLYALGIAPILGTALVTRDRVIYFLYSLAIVGSVVMLFKLRDAAGLSWTLWLILVVIASDVGGYFFGRILGGPKILPKISPKKTWSGTVGGWILAALIGVVMMPHLLQGPGLVWISVFAALAGQAGDIVESRLKRHVGVKDSSALIPGHGGFLDRFDALIGAALFLLIWAAINGGL